MLLHVQDPWYSLIVNSVKTVEGRLHKGKFGNINIGDILNVTNNVDMIQLKVIRVTKYSSFKEYLNKEGLDKTLPGINTIEIGCNVYYQFYTKDDEEKFGVLAIEIEKI